MSQTVYVLKNEFAPKVKVEDESFCINSYICRRYGSVKNLQKYNEKKYFVNLKLFEAFFRDVF
jgi:hypothetical protein